jgi:tRNA (guanine-N7-)-methyltransferase
VRKAIRLPVEELRPYTIETPAPVGGPEKVAGPAEVLDWRAVFGNDRSVEVEVGSGKGLFLLTAGQAHPETNYLGIEIVRKYQLYTATRLAKRQLHNVRVACADARLFLHDRIAAQSVQSVHVYFPDPWWKKRHHKRRVFTEEFARQCVRILRTGGLLLVATDVPDYATMVREVVAAVPELRETEAPVENAPAHDMDYLTNFERKFRKQGKQIYRTSFEKVGPAEGQVMH